MYGNIILSEENIKKLLERASLHDPAYICLPEHAEGYTRPWTDPNTYRKEEIDEMVAGICDYEEGSGHEY